LVSLCVEGAGDGPVVTCKIDLQRQIAEFEDRVDGDLVVAELGARGRNSRAALPLERATASRDDVGDGPLAQGACKALVEVRMA
jgi:hypothetical protein